MLGLGMVAVVEGLVLALAPSRLEDILEFLSQIGQEQRRTMGLIAVALGVAVVWFARG